MKKFSALLLAVLMSLSLLSATASATEPERKLEIGNLTAESVLSDTTGQPYAWSGPAPQVTQIEQSNIYGVDTDAGLIIKYEIKVTGIGTGKATFNGQPVEGEVSGYFINFGNAIDGLYYEYTLGPVTEPGDYLFTVTFRSVNSPYKEVSFSRIISVVYAE